MKSTRTIKFVSLLTTCLTLVFAAAFIWTPAAQAVTQTVCSSGATFTTLAAAVTDANTNFPTGGVTYDVCAGFTETAPAGGYVITAQGTAGNEIIFQKSGAGANPTITASGALTAGSLTDGLFKIVGGDYVTIDGFTLQENPANATTAAATNNMTEWGVALLHASTTNGAQNNTIKNCTISLNRSYTNTWGIYANNRHSATVIATTEDVTNNTTGPNSGNKVYANNISNVNMGIAFIGTSAAANQDAGNDVGGASAGTGNILSNWGGAAAVSSYVSNSGTSYGIFMNHQTGDNVSWNTLTSAAVSGTSVTFRGIFKDYTTTAPVGTFITNITNNTITMTSGFTSGTFEAIRSQGMTALSTATININNNSVLNCAVTGAASSSAIVGIVNSSVPGVLSMSNNTVRGNTSTATTGGFTGVSNTGAVVTTITLNNNKIGDATAGAITFSAATSGAVTGVANTGGAATAALSITGTDIRGITHTVAGSSAHTYITNSATTLSQNISTNTFTNLNVNTTGSVTFISNNVALPATGSATASNNSIATAFNKGGAGGTVTLYLTTTTPSSAVGSTKTEQNNNFSNITLTGATTMAGWMDVEGATGGGSNKTITGNTFSNWTCGTGAVNVIQLNYGGNGTSVSNNTISNISTTATSGGSITAISIGSSNGGASQSVSSNTITGLSAGTLGAATGITGGSSSITTLTISGNIINSLSSSNSTGSILGLSVTGGATVNVSGNVISTLAGSGTSTTVATGLSVTSGTTVNIFKNKIYDILQSGATTNAPAINGMLFSGGTTVTAYNNIIGDLRATTASSTDAIRGISITSTTTSSTYNLYYNTVWFAAASSGANFGTSGLYHAASATATTAALNLRNNIIDNRSTPSGTGVTVAYRRSVGTAGTLANYASASNNNDFSAGTPPSATRLIYSDGTSTATTIAAYKAGVFTAGTIAPRDTASFSDPTYLSTSGPNPNFLHIDPTIATQVESGAVNIAGITDDFDGQVRQGNAGYGGTGTAPDVGADEFGGIPLDLSPPTIAYATLGNGAVLTSRSLSSVTVTDASGVNTAAGTRPRVYYKKSTDANDLTGWKYVEANGAGGSPFGFTIDYTLLNAGSVSIGDVIQYFVVAQDSATTPNVGINSGAFAATPASVALTSAAFPIAGTINSYNIVATLTGTKTVCSAGPPTCDYGSLTNAGGVFADINSKVVGSNMDIQIASDLTAESGSNALGVIAEDPIGNYSVKIYPTGAARTVTGTGTGGILIGLIGSDRVTIDGSVGGVGTDRSLTLSNPSTATGTGTIFIGSLGAGAGATNDTIKNCIIKSTIGTTANFTFGVFVGSSSGAAAGPDNDNLTIRNNQILQARTGIQAVGDPTGLLDGLVIADNLIGDAAIATSIGRIGMTVQQTSGASVTGNTIKNIYIASDTSSPIALSFSSWTGGSISQNAIAGMQCSGSVAVAAIAGSSSTGVTITQNSIDGVAGAFAGTGSGDTYGITLGTGFINSSVTRNTIKNVTYGGTGGYGGRGIDISTANASSNLLIANNSISNIKGDGWSSFTSDSIVGIRILGTTGGVSLYYNSVNLGSGTFAGNSSGTLSGALYVDTSVTSLDVRNNVFATNLVNSTASTAKTYAIYSNAAASAFTFLDNNDYYASGTQGVLGFIGGSAKTTLADWQSATGKDALSIAANPIFNTSTDLQPSVGSPLLGAGVPVSVLVDIAGTTRSLTTPTIGAYESPISADLAVSQTDSPDPVATNGTVTYTVTVTNNGPYPATSPIMTVTIPTMFALAPITPPSGWSCTAPAGGIFTCSATSMAPSTSAIFPISYQVAYCAGNGTKSHNVTVSSATGDANPANNSSSEITTITDSGICSDNNPCTGPDLCSGTVCVPGPNPCEDNNACTNDVCGAGGSCTYTPVVCVDGNPCTDDSCNAATGCVYTNNTLPCSDGNICTIGDVCSAGACVPGPAPTPVTFCSTGSISIPSTGAATPYPSNVAVASGGSYLCKATVKLNGISHTFPADIDVLLVGPAGQNAIIMSDVGSSTAVSGVNLTLDDSAANPLPSGSGLSSGTFQPTNSGTGDTFPAPAPAPAGGSALSVFTGTNPIGTWSLYVYDDVSGDSGSMTGWCVNLAMACGTDADCGDGNPCTDDTCVGGGCVHTPNTASCDDGNACTTVDACAGGVCVGGSPVNCNDSDACTTDSCNPANGQCSHVAITCNDNNTCTDDTCNPATGCVYTPNDANTCADGNACTQTDLCQAGVCVGTNPVVCDDANPCTTDTCNTTSGACVYTNNTNPCNDGNACTTGDTCGPHFGQTFDGVTAPAIPAGWTTTLVVGQTGDPAWYTSTSFFDTPPNAAHAEDTTHSTDKVLDSPPIAIATASARLTFRNKYDLESTYDGCVLEISIGGGAFQDIIAAGGAFVSGGYNGTISATSTSTPLAGRSAWTGTSTGFVTSVVDLPPAAAGQSVVLRWRVATDLSLGNPGGEYIDSIALQDPAGPWTCQPGGPTNCDDSNPCTADSCNPATGCVHTPIVCNDGNACTADSCDVTLGCVYTPITCNDGNACTADSCNPATGCVYTPITCDDGNLCTADTCNAATGCVFTAISCDDANACTTDTCNPATGCAHTAITCDDNNLCTTDTCDPALGCVYTPISCDDNDACTIDGCYGPIGCVHTLIECGDANLCTTDTCNPATGCVYTPITCTDGNACTADSCNAATGCVYTPIVCDDGIPCTTDTCNPATGCVYTATSCDDGIACTIDSCDPTTGACIHAPGTCNDNNACTSDVCDLSLGCVYTPITCNDHSVCTTDSCNPATGCVYTPISCDDSNACTADTCNPSTGCVHTAVLSTGDTDGWSSLSQRTASGTFVTGPGTPPAGSGSFRMATGMGNSGPDIPGGGAGQGGKTWFSTQKFDGTLLSDITALSYWTWVTASPQSPSLTPTIQLQVDIDGDGTRDTTMVFEPIYSTVSNGGTQHNIAPGIWQDWDARHGKWWFTVDTRSSYPAGPVVFCSFNCFVTYDAIIAAHPAARIVTRYAREDGWGTQLVAGQNSASPPWQGFDGNVDEFLLAAATTDRSDFEPVSSCDDASVCTIDTCNPATGCVNTAITCDDSNACTADSCDPATGCVYSAISCDDGSVCTIDSCNPATGCVNAAITCDDNNPCTANSCDPTMGCTYTPICDINGHIYYNLVTATGPNPPNAGLDGPDVSKPVPGATVLLTSDLTGPVSSVTDPAGLYRFFPHIGGNVTIAPQPLLATETQCDNAITAADATRIAKSSVFLTALTPNERLAADVSANGVVTSFDASWVARRAVATSCSAFAFPVTTLTGSDWAWVPVSKSYTPLGGDVTFDFIGIMYGDVTGNWVYSLTAPAPGEAPTQGTDAAGFAAPTVPASQNATMYVANGPVQLANGSWQVVLGLQNSDGIFGLDMALHYDPAVVGIAGVATTGISSGLTAVQNNLGVEYAVGMFGTVPMQGTGQFVVVTYEVRQQTTGLPFTVSAEANEGQIPVTFSPALPGGPRTPVIRTDE